jgi:hypothetical protein
MTATADRAAVNPGTVVAGGVQRVLELARTWLVWDGTPRVAEDGARVYTPSKAIRRHADHLIDHLAEIEALLAGAPTEPGQRLGPVHRGRAERSRAAPAPDRPGLPAPAERGGPAGVGQAARVALDDPRDRRARRGALVRRAGRRPDPARRDIAEPRPRADRPSWAPTGQRGRRGRSVRAAAGQRGPRPVSAGDAPAAGDGAWTGAARCPVRPPPAWLPAPRSRPAPPPPVARPARPPSRRAS